MARYLEELTAEVTFRKGMDVDTHEYLVKQDRFDLLQNVNQTRTGAIRKRYGRTALALGVHRYYDEEDDEEATIPVPAFVGPVVDGEALVAHADELLLFDGEHAFTRMKDQAEWSFRSNHVNALCKSVDAATADDSAAMVQAASTNGYRCVAWAGPSAAVRYGILEIETGAWVVPVGDLDGISQVPTCLRLLAVGNTFVILWTDGAATIRQASINTATITDGRPETATINMTAAVETTAGQNFFDATPNPNTSDSFFVCYPENTSGINLEEFVVASTTPATTKNFGTAPNQAIAIFCDPDSTLVAYEVVVAWAHDDTSDVVIQSVQYSNDLNTQRYAPKTIYTESGATGQEVPNIVVGPGADTASVLVLWNLDSATVWLGGGGHSLGGQALDGAPVGQLSKLNGVCVQTTTSGSFLVTQEFQAIHNAHLVSTPIKWTPPNSSTGQVLFVVANDPAIQIYDDDEDEYLDSDTLDACFGLMRWERVGNAGDEAGPFRETYPEVCGVWRPGTAAGPRADNNPAWLTADDTSGIYLFGMEVVGRANSRADPDTQQHVSDDKAALGLLDLASYTERYASAPAGKARVFGGGMAHTYDRQVVTDLGFLWRPVLVPDSDPGATAGLIRYSAVYEWTDGEGGYHQSTPAVITSATGIAELSVIAYSWTPNKVRVAQYREHTDAIFYREHHDAGGATGRLYPGALCDRTDADGLIPLSTVATFPSALNSHQPLYTTGGVIPNEAGPSFIDVAEYEGRVWGVYAERPHELWFSKTIAENEGVAFSAFLRYPVGQENEPIVGIMAMDSFLVVFKKNKIYTIQGQPPSDLGQGSSLVTQEVPTDVGCKSAKSLVLTPLGIMFQSRKGIYLFARDRKPVYIGLPLDSSILGTYLVTSAVLVPEHRQVRFTFDQYSTIVVYDYLHDWWGFHTIGINLAEPGPAVMWDVDLVGTAESTYVLLADDGTAYYDDSTVWQDNGSWYAMWIRTAWLHLKDIQGYERFWKIFILGRKLGDFSCAATLQQDRDNSVELVRGWSFAQIEATPPIAAGYDRVQLEIRPDQPRAQAIRLQWLDIEPVGDPAPHQASQGCELTNIRIVAGIEPGSARLSSSGSGSARQG